MLAITHSGTYADFFKDKPEQDRGGGAVWSENPLVLNAIPGVCVPDMALPIFPSSPGAGDEYKTLTWRKRLEV